MSISDALSNNVMNRLFVWKRASVFPWKRFINFLIFYRIVEHKLLIKRKREHNLKIKK